MSASNELLTLHEQWAAARVKGDVAFLERFYGHTAVVTGVEYVKGTYRGQSGELAARFTSVLVWRAGRWQLVACQGTRVQAR